MPVETAASVIPPAAARGWRLDSAAGLSEAL